jgi:hypothetical protein
MSQRTVTFEDCVLIRETAQAVLAEVEGDEIWIPKSQFNWSVDMEFGQNTLLEINQWWAEKEGLI